MPIFANLTPCLQRLDSEAMETLARQIEREMHGEWRHFAIYEPDLERLWPLNEKDREAKIAQFATQYGFRLRFYSKGMCAIFDKWPPPNGQMMDAPVTPKA
jgi:hypothetical protein